MKKKSLEKFSNTKVNEPGDKISTFATHFEFRKSTFGVFIYHLVKQHLPYRMVKELTDQI